MSGLRREADRVWLLDQRLLPSEERWVDASEPDTLVTLIQGLAVRGAPAIGVAAALSLAWASPRHDRATWVAQAARLRAARPTAVNLMRAVDRMLAAADPVAEATLIHDEDVAACDRMAEAGAALLGDEQILTHCNTGAIATAGVGTALGVIARAWTLGRRIHVWVDETRPLLQGARLTAWELGRMGIPHTLLVDSAAAALMGAGKVDRVLVGADRIAHNGDFANKIGTYGLAVLARAHGIPFHVVAPVTTFDGAIPDGAAIPVEQRSADEVRLIASTPVHNPAFDVTPARLVTSYVTDRGVCTAASIATLAG